MDCFAGKTLPTTPDPTSHPPPTTTIAIITIPTFTPTTTPIAATSAAAVTGGDDDDDEDDGCAISFIRCIEIIMLICCRLLKMHTWAGDDGAADAYDYEYADYLYGGDDEDP